MCAGDTAADQYRVMADVQSLLMLIPALRNVTIQQLRESLPASLAGLALQPDAHHQQRLDAMATVIQQIIRLVGIQVSSYSPECTSCCFLTFLASHAQLFYVVAETNTAQCIMSPLIFHISQNDHSSTMCLFVASNAHAGILH